MKVAARGKELPADAQTNARFAPLRMGANMIGRVGISGPPVSKGTMGALGSLVAAAIERASAIERITATSWISFGPKQLRKKIEADPAEPQYPLTYLWVGYELRDSK